MKKKFIPQIFLVLLMGLTLLSTSGVGGQFLR